MKTLLLCLLLSACCHAGDVVRLRYERQEHGAFITGHGTAFGIQCGRKRALLTAAHNILDDNGKPQKTVLIEIDEEWRKVRVLFFSAKYDLALIEGPAGVEIGGFVLCDDAAAVGARVTLIGSKRGTPLKECAGEIVERHNDGTIRDRMRVAFDHGDSGGPVLAGGKVVGVAVAGVPKNGDLDTTLGLFVPASIVKEFLAEGK